MNKDIIINIKYFRKLVKLLRDNNSKNRVSDLFNKISYFTIYLISLSRTLNIRLINYLDIAKEITENSNI